jgi:hypothetical protein
MMQAVDIFIGSQVLTMVFPLGVLFGVLLWVFFQRNPTE